MTAAAAARHPGQRAGAWPSPAGRRRADRGHRRAGRAGRDRHRRRPLHRAGARSSASACSSPRCATRCSPGEIDFAVHSYKDLPTAAADRAAHRGRAGARGPARRAGRPRRARPSPSCRAGAADRHRRAAPGRPAARARAAAGGRADPRQRRHPAAQGRPDGDLDAVVLARAGLARLGRADAITETLDPMLMLPAPAQGALAVECRADDARAGRAARRARRRSTSRAAVTAERALLATLEAGLQRAGRRARRRRRGRRRRLEIFLRGAVTSPDGSCAPSGCRATGTLADAADVGGACRRLSARRRSLADGADDTLLGSTA